MKKNDVYLIGMIILAAVAFLVAMRLWRRHNDTGNGMVEVTVDGEVYGTYPLEQDLVEQIMLENGDYNLLQIRDGYAEVTDANCRDKICINHTRIRYRGETIVCLPHKVVVEIIGGEENDVDGVTH